MAKYSIVIGSLDLADGSVATSLPGYREIKYMRGDFNAVAKAAQAAGLKTFEDAVSWQRELLEAGKPAAMAFVKIGGV